MTDQLWLSRNDAGAFFLMGFRLGHFGDHLRLRQGIAVVAHSLSYGPWLWFAGATFAKFLAIEERRFQVFVGKATTVARMFDQGLR